MKLSKYALAQAPGLSFAHDASSSAAGMRIQLVKIDLRSEGVKVLNVNGPSSTYLELVRLLQEASDRLGEFFDIGLPVVTNVLAGSERELKGI
jgi:hypothetical protein